MLPLQQRLALAATYPNAALAGKAAEKLIPISAAFEVANSRMMLIRGFITTLAQIASETMQGFMGLDWRGNASADADDVLGFLVSFLRGGDVVLTLRAQGRGGTIVSAKSEGFKEQISQVNETSPGMFLVGDLATDVPFFVATLRPYIDAMPNNKPVVVTGRHSTTGMDAVREALNMVATGWPVQSQIPAGGARARRQSVRRSAATRARAQTRRASPGLNPAPRRASRARRTSRSTSRTARGTRR